jgi:hypothetical protein
MGGRVAEAPLRVDATSEAVELVLSKLVEPFNLDKDGPSPVRVTRKANGFAFKWRVVFQGISGDIGLIQANGDLLVSSGAVVVVRGSSDLYPGAYTNEVQTVSKSDTSKLEANLCVDRNSAPHVRSLLAR